MKNSKYTEPIIDLSQFHLPLKIKLCITTVFVLLFCSCESFVEVELPDNQINGETVFQNKGTATAALVNVYIGLRDAVLLNGGLNNITTALGHYADELEKFGDVDNYYNNSLQPLNSEVFSTWSSTYNLIYSANTVIEGLNSSNQIAEEDKNQLIGEALFVRAMMHFYLTNLFGDIPYISTTDFEKNNNASKLPVDQVYSNIIADLLVAKDLISDIYISNERTRPNKGCVSALLSRVYLYTEQWESAEQESSILISNTEVYIWETDVTKVFLKESPSTIWQLKPAERGLNSIDGRDFIFVTGPPPVTALSSSLINSFEVDDDRRTNWVGSVTDGTNTWYHAFKYKESENTGTSLEFSKQFRLAEQYLIRSEARAMLNDIPGAQSDLNIVRTRAGLPDTSAATTNDLLDAIVEERRVEFFVERGHRFFDLKRLNRIDAVLSAVKSGWDLTDVLFPIPEEELLANSNLLPQNPGY